MTNVTAEKTGAPLGTTSLDQMRKLLEEIGTGLPPSADSNKGGPRIEDLKHLLDISQAINATLELDSILEMVMTYAIRLVSAERGFIMLQEQGRLVMRQSYNLVPEQFGEQAQRFSQTIANRVLEFGESIYTSDALDDSRFDLSKSVADLHLRSIMGVPLKHDGHVLGLIYLDNSSQGRIFLQSDLYILELLAQQAAIALANAQLLANVRGLQAYAEGIVESTPVALLVLDSLSRVVHHNDRGVRLLRALGATAATPAWLDVVPRTHREEWAALLRGVLDTGRANSWTRQALEIDGESRLYRVLVSRLVTAADSERSLVLTLDDVTDAERMSEELAKAAVSIRKADQIGDVAHEMNNFLTVIYNQSQIFERNLKMAEYAKIERGLPRVLDASEKLMRLVEALLRPDRMEPIPRTFPLSTAFESLQLMLAADQRFGETAFDFDLPPDLPQVRFDPVHLEIVFYNLCKNAAEAMIDSHCGTRRVEIRGARQDGWVVLRVSDSGPGLPESRVAEPFASGHSTKSSGHGRGLHNTAMFVTKNGGDISHRQPCDLGGAEFTVRIPIAEP
jgi:signal transduction histidine kinase